MMTAASVMDNSTCYIPGGPPAGLNNGAPPTLPAPLPVTPSGQYSYDPPDTKERIEELCPVCGDKVSGYHYGILTCESCKGFFKRTVQNKKVYTCVADRNCLIDKTQRKRCPYCRFQKCLDVGMKLEAVRPDRMRGGRNKFGPMYKRDRARKLQLLRQKQAVHSRCLSPPQEMGSSNPFLSPVVSVPAGASSMYSPDLTQVKQELIQIPHLSSSTSSPDSSSSLQSSAQYHTSRLSQLANQQQHPSVSHLRDLSRTTWMTTSHPTTSPPNPIIHHPTYSPKPYQCDPGPSTAGPLPLATGGNNIPDLIREFQTSFIDDKEWQGHLFGILQSQTYNQCEVDLFELMCKVIDQSLFAQVDWARNTIFFRDLKVDDQMKLLQNSWSDLLLLDHLYHRIHSCLQEETILPNGQKFDVLEMVLLGLRSLADQFHRVSARLQSLKFDRVDYICLKILILLNPEVPLVTNVKLIQETHERTRMALLDYSTSFYPEYPDRYRDLLQTLSELRHISTQGEDFIYYKIVGDDTVTQFLLTEMLHAKRKNTC